MFCGGIFQSVPATPLQDPLAPLPSPVTPGTPPFHQPHPCQTSWHSSLPLATPRQIQPVKTNHFVTPASGHLPGGDSTVTVSDTVLQTENTTVQEGGTCQPYPKAIKTDTVVS